MAEMTIRLIIDPATGKKNIVVKLHSDADALPQEHEQMHRELVDKLVNGGVVKATEVGKIVVGREGEEPVPVGAVHLLLRVGPGQDRHPVDLRVDGRLAGEGLCARAQAGQHLEVGVHLGVGGEELGKPPSQVSGVVGQVAHPTGHEQRALGDAAVAPAPLGPALDLDAVGVRVRRPGADGLLVRQDLSAPCDEGAEGWQPSYDLTAIRVCGAMCNSLQADPSSRIELVIEDRSMR